MNRITTVEACYVVFTSNSLISDGEPMTQGADTAPRSLLKPAGVFSPKLSRILPQKGAVSPSPAWLKKFEPTVTQNPMTMRRFFIIVIEKYLGKESNSKRCVPISTLAGSRTK
ncbi:hypothetical protein AVEN_47386-1 [Araneus ventricosus]|uniref:Uncharacterized protein n=1 Tax=Araneus ventricosus TaxID=182803 RepID=A0A4Y2PQ52_ARAVE|nr:hypothetical protein AVEN_47386-1 [Araneus ventricosus]